MGEKNIVLNTYMSKPERIQSVLEYYTKEKFPENWASVCKEESGFTAVKNKKGRISHRQRDIFKRIDAQEGTYYVGIENQVNINLIFPWRLMQMDCLAYERQIEQIKQNNKKNSVKYSQEDDYLYHYLKKDRLKPIINLVLYWGKNPWIMPKGLKDMMSTIVMPCGMQRMLEEYKIHLISMREIPDEALEAMDSDLKYVLGLMKRADSLEEYKKYIYENRDYFCHMPKSAVDVLHACVNLKAVKAVLEYQDVENGEEEETDMCKALDMLAQESFEQGIEQGIEVFILDHQEDGTPKERVLEKLIGRFGLDSEKAKIYLMKYNYL